MGLIQAILRQTFAFHQNRTAFLQSSVSTAEQQPIATIKREKHTDWLGNISVLLLIMTTVGLLHVLGIQCFFWPEPVKEALKKPVAMQISMITLPAEKAEAISRQAPTPSKNKPSTKKVQLKPKLLKQDLAAEGMAFSRQEQELRQRVRDFDMRQFTIVEPDRSKEMLIQTYTEAYLDAAYDRNPKPEYPSIARSNGWQGRVILRVQISEKGKVEAVNIEKSSEHDLLDESAVEAVKHWTFVPAMRGNKTIATSVLVPIIFTLQSQEAA